MCFGGNSAPAIQQPQIVYRGPSDDDIRRSEQGLADFQRQMTEKSDAFNRQLQSQIDAANQQYANLESQFASELASATSASNAATSDAQAALTAAQGQGAAAMAAAQAQGLANTSSAYTVETTESEPVNTQQTAAITKKKKENTGLKITPNAQAVSAGTGLNIGV